jgi:hypothetical protein
LSDFCHCILLKKLDFRSKPYVSVRMRPLVQLAAAMEVHTRGDTLGLLVLTLVSADDDLNNAATAEGLAVENPNRH